MTEEQRYDKSGRSLQERIHYWRDIMDAKSGWANDVSGPCCDKCRMTKPKDPLQALVGCRDPFQINCQCHIPYREAVRKLIIRELEAVDTTPLPELQPINNDLTRAIDKFHDAVLNTDASGRPDASLFDNWMALKAMIEPTTAQSTIGLTYEDGLEAAAELADQPPTGGTDLSRRIRALKRFKLERAIP